MGAVLFRSGTNEGAVAAKGPAFPDGHSTAKRDGLPVAVLWKERVEGRSRGPERCFVRGCDPR